MLQISVETTKVSKNLNRVIRRKIPGGIAKGLTRLAYDVRDGEKAGLPKFLDRPTRFTMNSFSVKRATSTARAAYVYLRPLQRAYMRYQILGGIATKPHLVPSRSWPKNAYGNIPRFTTRGAGVFKTLSKTGRPMYFKKAGTKNNLRADYIGFIPASRSYRKRFPFYAIGTRTVQANYTKLDREIRRAIG